MSPPANFRVNSTFKLTNRIRRNALKTKHPKISNRDQNTI